MTESVSNVIEEAAGNDVLSRVYTTCATKIGTIFLCVEEGALVGAWLEKQKHFPEKERLGKFVEAHENSVLSQAVQELEEYFRGQRTVFEIPLRPEGTDFQLAVWNLVSDIRYGYTDTYGAISRVVGPGAPAQAVGQAVGRNPCIIFIPCHRVLGAGGKITGYAGGLSAKQWLLELERPQNLAGDRLF
ncbi:methylated-DNA--[protein]-cysteine S-methyltransferase [Rothia sp. P7208]|uniref:methylated-DNA--[protein]-cysteine S-methyltransferase n=1 Tax=Rothia sp. P7208 TaxID=3402660 RepID=UPI003AC07F11